MDKVIIGSLFNQLSTNFKGIDTNKNGGLSQRELSTWFKKQPNKEAFNTLFPFNQKFQGLPFMPYLAAIEPDRPEDTQFLNQLKQKKTPIAKKAELTKKDLSAWENVGNAIPLNQPSVSEFYNLYAKELLHDMQEHNDH